MYIGTTVPFIATAMVTHRYLDIPSSIAILSSSVGYIYSVIDSIKKYHSYSGSLVDLNNFILEYDLRAKLEIYSLMMNDLGDVKNATIRQCVFNILDTIKLMELEMKKIEKCLQYNNSLIFAKSWRSYDFKSNLETLKCLTKQLENRISMFETSCRVNSLLKDSSSINITKSFVSIKGNIVKDSSYTDNINNMNSQYVEVRASSAPRLSEPPPLLKSLCENKSNNKSNNKSDDDDAIILVGK